MLKNGFKNYLTEAIDRIVRKVLTEMANNNLKMNEFERDIKSFGFVFRNGGTGSGRVYSIKDKNGGTQSVTVHYHPATKNVKADSVRHVFNTLRNIGWFEDAENFRRFPFSKWGFSPKNVYVDTTDDDISRANQKYKNATVRPIFPMKNSICTLENGEKVNLCRSTNDRRPLLDVWFDLYEYDEETHTIPCLKHYNYQDSIIICFPIRKDGTLDVENRFIER